MRRILRHLSINDKDKILGMHMFRSIRVYKNILELQYIYCPLTCIPSTALLPH